jgi:biotin carboxylase
MRTLCLFFHSADWMISDVLFVFLLFLLLHFTADGVKLCHTFQEAKEHFLYLSMEHELVNGGSCGQVLCQEFLKGKEYVVDQVSLDGVHKTIMVWVYDKRDANGASFVYFGDIPFESDTPEAQLLIPYARDVLDALGVKHGPSHGEFIMTDDGPCLVEMNCRCHGGDGLSERMVSAMTGGYNQVNATVASYLDKEKFMNYPDRPAPFRIHGQCVDLVSFSEGIVMATPGYERIQRLPSFVHLEANIGPGSKVSKTVDMITDIGGLIVMHHDPKVLEQDIAIIRALEKGNAMFEYEPKAPSSLLERKLSVPKDPNPVFYLDAMPPSMYLERKLSTPKEDPSMYIEKN